MILKYENSEENYKTSYILVMMSRKPKESTLDTLLMERKLNY